MSSEQGLRDPRAAYRAARVAGCRYEVASSILRDPAFLASAPGEATQPMWRMFRRWMIRLDGERHRQIRERFSGVFGPRRVEAYRCIIEERTAGLLDDLAPLGRMEMVGEFASPLPFNIVSDVVGIPEDRRPWVRERMAALMMGFGGQRGAEYVQHANEATDDLYRFFGDMLDARAAQPRDDLLSLLAADLPQDPGERADVVCNCVGFVNAGNDTTASMLSGGLLLLLENPQALVRVRDDGAATVCGAVEEILRHITPVNQVLRCPIEDRVIGGTRFSSGERRFAWLGAANLDPDVFSDPDRFDIDREPNRHLAFGMGRHFCLGASLARLHAEVALPALLRRLVGIRLDGEPEWRPSLPLRQLERLPLAWEGS